MIKERSSCMSKLRPFSIYKPGCNILGTEWGLNLLLDHAILNQTNRGPHKL